MKQSEAKALWVDTARFWVSNVAQSARVEDVVALMLWPEHTKTLKWAKSFGRKQIFVSAVSTASQILSLLEIRETRRNAAQ